MRNEQHEWMIAVSASAWRAAQKLEAYCERCGLDSYVQVQICLTAAIGTLEEELWSQVWDYIQLIEGKGWNERLLVEIVPDGDAGNVRLAGGDCFDGGLTLKFMVSHQEIVPKCSFDAHTAPQGQ